MTKADKKRTGESTSGSQRPGVGGNGSEKAESAAQRIEKGEPKPKDVNPLAPAVNIEAGS